MKFTLALCFLCLLYSCETTAPVYTTNGAYRSYTPPDLSKVTYEGGDGTSVENAIVIKNAANDQTGVAAEYAYIERKYGKRYDYWKLMGQSTNMKDGRRYDYVVIKLLADNQPEVGFYFDITDFYGKL